MQPSVRHSDSTCERLCHTPGALAISAISRLGTAANSLRIDTPERRNTDDQAWASLSAMPLAHLTSEMGYNKSSV